MDKEQVLNQLGLHGRFWKLEFEYLSPLEQVFRAVMELDFEVRNGGFHQYYFNYSGDAAYAIVEALETIGAHHVAKIVEQANGVFPDSEPPAYWETRREQLALLGSDRLALLDELNEKFYKCPDNLMDLLYEYVRMNAKSIEGTDQVGLR